jgi:hypothetical protein
LTLSGPAPNAEEKIMARVIKNPKGTPANLLDLSKLSKETKRQMSSNGGKKAQAIIKEKKLLSALYAKTIADMYDVDLEGEKLTFPVVIKAILARGDAASVSMLKEIREATEGSKMALTGSDGGPIQVAKIERVIIDANTVH